MNIELESYLRGVKPKENHKFLNGEKQFELHFEKLNHKVKEIIPSWLKIMLMNYEVANLLLEFKTLNEEEISIRFNTFENIEQACLGMYPGCAIFNLGYLEIGEDPTGSGDPYFIKIDEGNNPPVYQIYHDISDQGEEIIKHGKKLIVNKLSDIFANQIL